MITLFPNLSPTQDLESCSRLMIALFNSRNFVNQLMSYWELNNGHGGSYSLCRNQQTL